MRRLIAALAALVLVVPSGCGGDDDTGSDASGATTPDTAAPLTEVEAGSTTTIATTTQPPPTEAATTQPESVPWPSARGYSELVPGTQPGAAVLIAGGTDAEELRDVWSVDLADASWTRLADVPPDGGPVGGALAADTEAGLVVVLEAVFEDPEGPVVTGIHDLATDTWVEVTSEPQPRLGVGARMVFDRNAGRFIAFGGLAVGDGELVYTRATWAFDPETRTWEERAPGVEPPGLNYHAMAYDEQSDRTVLHGLSSEGETFLWAYDYQGDAWEELALVGGPATASVYQRAVYDPVADRVLVFGGLRPEDPSSVPADPEQVFGSLVGHDELWSYDYDTNSWEQAASNELSGPLCTHAMTMTVDGTVVVFGGGPTWDDYTGDGLWTYDPATDTWTEHGA